MFKFLRCAEHAKGTIATSHLRTLPSASRPSRKVDRQIQSHGRKIEQASYFSAACKRGLDYNNTSTRSSLPWTTTLDPSRNSSDHAMTSPRFQIISDLHLETPIQTPSYAHFSAPTNFPLLAPNLFLLGDIGLIAHTQPLLTFLRSLLSRSPTLRIFYVLGNHEPYHQTLENALSQISSIETTLNHDRGPHLHLMHRRRIDLDATTTLLGCTLWSHVPAQHAHAVASALKDFDDKTGIWDRSLDDHNADHAADLEWLNKQVALVEGEEPRREIVILTHHSPTADARANSSRFPPERPLNTGFRTDLSRERCWMSESVKVWAYGHTHFNCQFVEGGEGESVGGQRGRRKLVVSNQKGYAYPGGKGSWTVEPVVVGREEGMWKVVVGEKTGNQWTERCEAGT